MYVFTSLPGIDVLSCFFFLSAAVTPFLACIVAMFYYTRLAIRYIMCITNQVLIDLHEGITYIPLPVKAGINKLAQKNICYFISLHAAFCSRGNAVKLLKLHSHGQEINRTL